MSSLFENINIRALVDVLGKLRYRCDGKTCEDTSKDVDPRKRGASTIKR